MDKFWELLEESVILQGIITLVVVGTYAYLLITVQPVPETLTNLLGLIMGFFFGGKMAVAVRKASR